MLKTEEARKELLKLLVDSALESDLSRGVLWSGPGRLPRRWLPHGSYHELYILYCAHQTCAGEKVASTSTFYRTLTQSGWKKKLRFSPPSAHSKCSVCAKLRSQIQHASGIQEHTTACDRLLRHLAGQYSDRETYWTLRTRAKTTGDILCAITDSMDKSKYALPRFHRGRTPKDIETMKRPNCEVTTTMIHGVGIYTYIGDENQSAGSNWVLETLSRSLQHAYVKHQKQNKPLPSVISIFADNTPKEPCHKAIFSFFLVDFQRLADFIWFLARHHLSFFAPQEVKKTIFGAWCSAMTAAGYARTICHQHLPVGHTHEDIGILLESPVDLLV